MEYLLSFTGKGSEDIILYHLLKNVNVPIRYVDVGANDPVMGSVTKLFYERGASGINIEPQQEHIEHLKKDRPRDINLAVGVSDKAGELTLYGKGGFATFNQDSKVANMKMTHTVPVVTLSDIFNQYTQKDEDIHFLKIDVEGWERQCLEGMDFIHFRPWILCIEYIVPNTDIPCYEDWEELVLGQNYTLLGASGLNRYYAATERLHEIQEFLQPTELGTIYRIVSFIDCQGSLYDKYLFCKSIIYKTRAKTSILLDKTALGKKIKSSLKSLLRLG